ncbi:MAG: hypothetical protein R3E10_08160 [Gemmatimonadota bacterium]
MGAAVLVAYLLLRVSPYLALGALSDDAIYVSLGKALAEGEGYRSIYAVGSPVHAKYPPGLPLLYAFFWSVGGGLTRVQSMALFSSTLASATAAGLLWWTGRVRLGAEALPLAVLCVGAFLIETAVQFFNLAVSEPWFLLGWAGALALVPWAAEGRVLRALWLGSVLGLTTLFRSQALFLVPAFMVAIAWLDGARSRGSLRAILVGGAAALPVLVWRMWHARMLRLGPGTTQPDEASYESWFPAGTLGERIAYFASVIRHNARGYATFLPDHLAPAVFLGWAVLAVLVVYMATAIARRARVTSAVWLALLAQGALLSIWPFAQDRFYAPLLPVMGLLAAGSPLWAVSSARRVGQGVLVAVAAVVGVRQVQIRAGVLEPTDTRVTYHASRYLLANSVSLVTAAAWVDRNTRPDDRLLAPFAASLFLYTGRQGVNAEPAQPDVGGTVFERPGAFLAGRVQADQVTVVLLLGSEFQVVRDVAAVQQGCPGALEFLGSVTTPAEVAAYRVHPDACLLGLAEG